MLQIQISRFLGFTRWASVSAMSAFLGWIFFDAVTRGDTVSLCGILGFMAAVVAVVAIDLLARKGKVDQIQVDHGWERTDHLFSPRRLANKIYKAHQHTFPLQLCQKGIIGRAITARRRDGQGRQGHASRRNAGSGKASNSDDGGDGEPPRSTSQHLFLSFHDLAIRWSCSPKTLRNQVSCGKLPRPAHLPIGPRFPIAVIQQIESGEWQQPNIPDQPTRTRGRPRIANIRKPGCAA